ncbi:MAG: hypothetical protein H7X77_04375 [Anaerolineae bacterium]|nr:hypothetical protein [Anaerolineae bacterium]
MQRLEAAIMRTILYGDVFNFAMTLPEIHHYLIADAPVTLAEVEQVLASSPYLQTSLCYADGYYACRGELIAQRVQRQVLMEQVWSTALIWGRWLARLPFVRMVALTGALAAQNPAHADDDFDYLLVTQPGRVWLARAFAIVLVRLGKLRGVVICPNYVIAADTLTQTRQDMFMAHEVTQMIPLYGQAMYQVMRAANPWTDAYLPNALTVYYAQTEVQPGSFWQTIKTGLETLLSGGLGDKLEQWEYRRKLHRFAANLKTPHSSAQLDSSHVKGHFNDHGHPVLRRYQEHLRRYHLEDEALAMAGD